MLGLGLGLVRGIRPLGGFVGLLDLVPNAAAAYSLRKLRAAYSGAAVRVRESGGNTEADIGFTSAGELDTSALLAHCGANDGFVTVWYDQSLSNNATQTTANNQPKIVSAGSLVTENGNVAIDFDGVNDVMNAASANLITGNSAYGIFTVGKSRTTLSTDYYWGVNATLNGTGNGLTISLTPEIAVRVSGNCVFSNSASGTQELLSLLYNGTIIQNHSLYINGVNSSVSSSSSGTSPMNVANGDFRIGGWGLAVPGFFDGTMQEVVVYSSDQSANRTAIETNIKNFWGI